MADEREAMQWKEVHELTTKSNALGFYRALEVWIEKPHVVNRRLSGSILLNQQMVALGDAPHSVNNLIQYYSRSLLQKHIETTSQGLKDDPRTLNLAPGDGADSSGASEHAFVVILRKLLPRRSEVTSPLLEFIFVGEPLTGVRCITSDTHGYVWTN